MIGIIFRVQGVMGMKELPSSLPLGSLVGAQVFSLVKEVPGGVYFLGD